MTTSTRSSSPSHPMSYQHVVIMRHGDRADFVDPTWVDTATRKWDPELVTQGITRAFKTGQKIRTHLADVSIHRGFVSPFLRCLQTAAEAVSALVANVESVDDLDNYASASHASKIKVAIEYGLCEMLNSRAITPEKAPKDGIFSFDIPYCESILPAGTIDHNVEPIYKEMPKWEETVEETLARYVQTTKALADKYLPENLLLVTHAAGVLSVLQELKGGADGAQVEYCGYLYLKRPIYPGENKTFTAGQFELVGLDGVNVISS
ncbi:hypothetical protein LIER_36844 [Lithospermum erythrorhizon]|uniref:Phosphoglycerate mutase family protein n=1 Tax=Lithospermum erythrorhizon TaxID=34254 RepID=A0AAV3PFR4_LITER